MLTCCLDHEFPPVEVKCLQKFSSSGTLERKCDNCRTIPSYGGIQQGEQLNHSWNQSKKVRPVSIKSYRLFKTKFEMSVRRTAQ